MEIGIDEDAGHGTGLGVLRVGLQPDEEPGGLGGLRPTTPIDDLAQVGVHAIEGASDPAWAPADAPERRWARAGIGESPDSGQAS